MASEQWFDETDALVKRRDMPVAQPEVWCHSLNTSFDSGARRLRNQRGVVQMSPAALGGEAIIIRQEFPADYDEVHELVEISFVAASFADGTEADYLNNIRKKDTFIPEPSPAAVTDGKIAGQIVLYKTNITTDNGDVNCCCRR